MNVTQSMTWRLALVLIAMLTISRSVIGQEKDVQPITLENVEPPPAIAPDEPFAKVFSLQLTARYLDNAALQWQKTHACTACHTMLPYLMARPALNSVVPQPGEVRQFFEEVVAGKREAMPDYTCNDVDGAVAIGVASALALNDRWSTGKLHPLTRQALDRMWTLQRADGAWQWPFRDTPPLKLNEHYGVTLAAIAAGMAPDDYANTPTAEAGLAGVRRYLSTTKPGSLHQQAMLLWASVYVYFPPTPRPRSFPACSKSSGPMAAGPWLASLTTQKIRHSTACKRTKPRPNAGTAPNSSPMSDVIASTRVPCRATATPPASSSSSPDKRASRQTIPVCNGASHG